MEARMRVVLYNLEDPETKVTVSQAYDAKDARRIMALFRKGGWKVNRRPDADIWDNVVLTFVRD